jgi:hypothetical protein
MYVTCFAMDILMLYVCIRTYIHTISIPKCYHRYLICQYLSDMIKDVFFGHLLCLLLPLLLKKTLLHFTKSTKKIRFYYKRVVTCSCWPVNGEPMKWTLRSCLRWRLKWSQCDQLMNSKSYKLKRKIFSNLHFYK